MDVKNFYLKKNVFDLDDLMSNPSSYIGGFNNQFIIDVVKDDKKKYIEDGLLTLDGSLIFNEGNKEIGGIPLFDDLASLYAYYLNAVEEFMTEEVVDFYYPSQPIEVRLQKVNGNKTKISVDSQSLVIDTELLLNSILSNSESFFKLLVNELKLGKYAYEIKQIENIKEKLRKAN